MLWLKRQSGSAIYVLGHLADAFCPKRLTVIHTHIIHSYTNDKVPTSTPGVVWGSVSCPKTLRQADQGNWTSNQRRWFQSIDLWVMGHTVTFTTDGTWTCNSSLRKESSALSIRPLGVHLAIRRSLCQFPACQSTLESAPCMASAISVWMYGWMWWV